MNPEPRTSSISKVSKSSLKIYCPQTTRIHVLRHIKYGLSLKVSNKQKAFSRNSKKAICNLKCAYSIKCEALIDKIRNFLNKFNLFIRLLKSNTRLRIDHSPRILKRIKTTPFLYIQEESAASFRNLRFFSFIKTLCIYMKSEDIEKVNKFRIKCHDLYLKPQVLSEANVGSITQDFNSLKWTIRGSKYIILDLESYLYDLRNSLMPTHETEAERNARDEENVLKEMMNFKDFTQKIVSLTLYNSFLEIFKQSHSLVDFPTCFSSLHYLGLTLVLDEPQDIDIENLKLPESIQTLSLKLQISFYGYNQVFETLKAMLFEIIKLPNLSDLSLKLDSNNHLLTIFFQVLSVLPECKSLRVLRLSLGHSYSLATFFETKINRSELEAFPISNLFESLAKLEMLEKIDIKIPGINERDIINLSKINLTKLKNFKLTIREQKGLRDEDIRSLVRFMTKNNHLASLDLSICSNDVTNIGVKNVCYQLAKLKSLTRLTFTLLSDKVTDASVAEISKMILNLSSLKKANLHLRAYDPTPFYQVSRNLKHLQYLKVSTPYFLFESN